MKSQVTLKTIAKALNLSTSTVSRACVPRVARDFGCHEPDSGAEKGDLNQQGAASKPAEHFDGLGDSAPFF